MANYDESRSGALNLTDQTVEMLEEQDRIFRVDIHSHVIPKNLPDFAARYGYSGFPSVVHGPNSSTLILNSRLSRPLTPAFFDITVRLSEMSRDGVDLQVLTIPPCFYSYWAKADDTADLCRIINNSLYQIHLADPKKFLPLCTLPMQAPELAIKELTRCVSELNFSGCVIGTSVNDWTLDSIELSPFWETVEKLNSCVYVHSGDLLANAYSSSRFSHNNSSGTKTDRKFDIAEVVGVINETTKTVTRCVLSGLFEKFPKIRVCFAHGAGAYSFISQRVNTAYLRREHLRSDTEISPDNFLASNNDTENIRKCKFWCDSVVAGSEALELILNKFGEDRVVFGAGYPFDLGETFDKQNITYLGQTLETLCEEKFNKRKSSSLKEKVYWKNAMEFLNKRIEDFI